MRTATKRTPSGRNTVRSRPQEALRDDGNVRARGASSGRPQGLDAGGQANQRDHDDDELAARLRSAVTRLNRRLRQESLAGLSPAQASVLGIVDRLGTPTLGEVAFAEQVQPPTMTRLVAGMQRSGLLVRTIDPSDRRVFRVKLTTEGRRTLHRIRSLKNAFFTRRFAGLGPDDRRRVVQLADLLERLVAEP